MREIKFREPLFDTDGNFSRWHYWGLISKDKFVGPVKLSGPHYQYTGSKVDGVEIYDDDFLGGSYTHRVKWDEDGFDVFSRNGMTPLKSFLFQYETKIIGNTTENPELLP